MALDADGTASSYLTGNWGQESSPGEALGRQPNSPPPIAAPSQPKVQKAVQQEHSEGSSGKVHPEPTASASEAGVADPS